VPIVGLELPEGKVRFEDLKDEVLMPVYHAVQLFTQEEHHRISVTKLVGCLRQHYAMEKLEVYVPVTNYLRLMYGSGMHRMLHTMEVPVAWETPDGITVNGSIDYVDEEYLIDFKTIRRLPGKTLDHHALQVNLYHFLLRHNTIGEKRDIPHLAVVYIDFDGHYEYHRVRIKNYDYLHNFICERAKMLHDALEKDIPPPMEEGWICQYCFIPNCGQLS